VANDDSFSITPGTVSCGGVSQGGYCYQTYQLPVMKNDVYPTGVKGGYVTLPAHGTLSWDQANFQYLYTPSLNGPYTDSFVYEDDYQGRSSRGVVHLTVNCSTAAPCNS
jgi:hypothetical protein